MSTEASVASPTTPVEPVPWRSGTTPDHVETVHLFAPGGSDPQEADVTREFVLPSVIAAHSAAAERQGFERGFSAGEQAGLDSVRQRYTHHLTRLAATIDEISARRTALFQKSEQD